MRHWYRRGPLAWLLWPASLLFGVAAFFRRAFTIRRQAGLPVVVVGNLVAGGSGKTPLVLWIAEHLKASGWHPAIVSRGYPLKIDPPRAATIASDPREVGDEPVVLARRSGCPVWVGADRVAAIRALRQSQPEVDVVLLDDGLQHYRLARDLEIAVVDSRGFGNGFLLPAGPLREPSSRLRSVDAVVSHGAAVPGYAMTLEGAELHRMTDARERRGAAGFAARKVHAVAGIGDPGRFFRHLARLGLEPLPHPFPDHHAFQPQELDFGDGLPVVLTEKDAVKLRGAARPEWWVLPVTAKVDPAFGDWLIRRLDEFRRRSKAA
ncbi:MAG TPA: tetraacyldisaccharide 4'-kinase [Burkholderiales bacterium]|nr:tetraacyldisaccharide 4'-kinase [Burkholderiales bacterium]